MPQTSKPVYGPAPGITTPGAPPLLRVLRPNGGRFYWLSKGREGSYQTAALMANLVREDAVKDEGLERFAKQLLIDAGLDSHADSEAVASVMFRYCQTLAYIHDPAGQFDAIQSARQTIANQYGDCDDLSVLLATLLAMVGFKPRFVLARYKSKAQGAESDGRTDNGFEHIYVDLDLPAGRYALDPSTRQNGPGWEAPNAIERVAYPIFNGAPVSLGSLLAKGYQYLKGVPVNAGETDAGTNSTTGGVKVVALAAPGVSLPVVLCILTSVGVAMKLASKL